MVQRIIPVTLRNLSAVVLVLQLFGCGGGSSDNGNTSGSAEAVISGSVGDGPIVGATLNIYDKNGNLIQTEISDTGASYSARIKAPGNAYPLTIEAINGTDLVTGRDPDFSLTSVIQHPSEKRVNINPFTTLIVESARSLPGGLTEQNVATVTATVITQLNFGLDPALVDDPFGADINNNNIGNIVKSSEALGEMIRRARDNLMLTGTVSSADEVVGAIADDIADGVLDGLGGARADGRIAAVATLTSAQVLIEALSNNLKVDGLRATDALDNAILTVRPTAAGAGLTSNVRITQEMLEQARTTVAAARALSPAIELKTIADILDVIQPGSLPSEIEPVLPGDSSQDLDQAITLTASATEEQLASVNDFMRADQGSSTADPVTSTDPVVTDPVTTTQPIVTEPVTSTDPIVTEPITITNSAPVISGTPALSVKAGTLYSFQPSASDPDGDSLTFSIQNRPAWASFNSSTGRLSGTPGSTDVGTYNNIVVSVSDGSLVARLPAFSISVDSSAPKLGSVSLTWAAPVARTDGNALAMGEIAGYTLYYGTSQGNYPNSVDINDAYTTSATVSNLPVDTYYFVVTAKDIAGQESGYSSVATKVVQ